MAIIDERAVIDPEARLADDVVVGPYSVIGAHVKIGSGTEIGPHVAIAEHTTLGKNNKILQFASLGTPPQDNKYQGEPTVLELGDNNVIREFCTLNRGTVKGGGKTKIGDRNFFMSYVHIAHDCQIGNDVVFANNATLAGHVEVGDHSVFGGFTVIAQHRLVGAYSFITGTTALSKDIPPYVLISTDNSRKASACGLNSIGLRRGNFSRETIKRLKEAYQLIFHEGLTVKEVLPKLEAMVIECPEIQLFVDILKRSKYGIVR